MNRFFAALRETHANAKLDEHNGKLLTQNDFDATLFLEFCCWLSWRLFSNVCDHSKIMD